MSFMNDLNARVDEINKKLDELLRRVNTLQDFLLQLSTALEAANVKAVERELLSQIAVEIDEELSSFRRERPSNCPLRDLCTRRVEKAAFRVLQTFAYKGADDALKELRGHVEAVGKHAEDCPSDGCLKSAVRIFKVLEELVEHSKQTVAFRREIFRQWGNFDEIDEEEVADMLTSISNSMRIKILKILSKGRKNYVDIERMTGMRGGHLQFHLRNLIDTGYVTQEKPKGKYLITSKGLRVLKLMCELKREKEPTL
ncbi:MAG: winged helix-turn-helix domain-containing protein [Candidatus Jordarchaeales archaeon]